MKVNFIKNINYVQAYNYLLILLFLSNPNTTLSCQPSTVVAYYYTTSLYTLFGKSQMKLIIIKKVTVAMTSIMILVKKLLTALPCILTISFRSCSVYRRFQFWLLFIQLSTYSSYLNYFWKPKANYFIPVAICNMSF